MVSKKTNQPKITKAKGIKKVISNSFIETRKGDRSLKITSLFSDDKSFSATYHNIMKIYDTDKCRIYKANEVGSGRLVAIKTMTFTTDEDRQRFFQECGILLELSHPNIIHTYKMDICEKIPYIVMEYLDGYTVKELVEIANLGLYDIKIINQMANIIKQAAQALHYAHHFNIMHRDVKPANLMLLLPISDYLNQLNFAKFAFENIEIPAKLIDFGIAKNLKSSSVVTKKLEVLGTPCFMSPEQVCGDKMDYRTDIFSLGTSLFNLITGENFYFCPGGDVYSILQKILDKEMPNPRKINKYIPKELADICFKATRHDPDDRWQTALEMAQAIGCYLYDQRPDKPNLEIYTNSEKKIKSYKNWKLFT